MIYFLLGSTLGLLLGITGTLGYFHFFPSSDWEYNITTIREDMDTLLVKFDQLLNPQQ
jgi:hypothetical protein